MRIVSRSICFAFILILMLSIISCKKNCDSVDPTKCTEEIVASITWELSDDCKCMCRSGSIVFTSPIDKQKFCMTYLENTHKGADREVYLYDHYQISRDGIEERLAGPVFCYFNEISVKDKVNEYPDQGVLVIRSESRDPDNCMPNAHQGIAFYLKNGSKDTLFFDKPVDFYEEWYWMCHSNYYIKGFAVRKADRLEWHFGMYNFKDLTPLEKLVLLSDMEYDISPDTVMQFTTMRVM